MKQILIKLAALGLLFSVVSTYACDGCGCNHKASEHFRPGETSKAGNGEHVLLPAVIERSNDDKMRVGEVNEDVR